MSEHHLQNRGEVLNATGISDIFFSYGISTLEHDSVLVRTIKLDEHPIEPHCTSLPMRYY